MNLNYFTGKACTIFTSPVNRAFSEKQLQDYFVGFVESVDSSGIWTKSPITGCKNFYPMQSIIGICEEQIVDNPKVLEKYKEAKKEVVKPTFIDPKMLTELAQQAKQLNQKSTVS